MRRVDSAQDERSRADFRVTRIPFSLPSLRCARPIRQIVQECLPLPPVAGVSGMDLRLLYIQDLAHDDRQNFNFLFRQR